MRGDELIEDCKTHILETMQQIPECAPDGPGLGNKAIEGETGFALGLQRQDGWFNWSLLISLVQDDRLEAVEGKRGRLYRLVA